MGVAKLAGLRMTADAESYVDALHAVLSHKGWTSLSKPMLSGMTAFAFRFVVDRRLTAEAATAYNWMAEHFVAADLIGVVTSQQAGFRFDATFPLYREHAVPAIKASIDRGVGAIAWKDAFVVVTGYDDEKALLYCSDGKADEDGAIPYASFGRNESPYWYYQIAEDIIELDDREVVKESWMQAVAKWESHDPMLPEAEYACGKNAYDAAIAALGSGQCDPGGARELLRRYAAAKRQIALYAAAVRDDWAECGAIAEAYAEAAALFQAMTEADGRAPRLIRLLEKARRAEERAIAAIRSLLRESIGNRFGDTGLR
ncbi:hypothetical protein [Paenibacillus sp. GYB003]|uniref:hypothetical protein n=1 Tax=Paenibacillus sp. GYB003 TaxID=2994392 RepID=UPI002F96A019